MSFSPFNSHVLTILFGALRILKCLHHNALETKETSIRSELLKKKWLQSGCCCPVPGADSFSWSVYSQFPIPWALIRSRPASSGPISVSQYPNRLVQFRCWSITPSFPVGNKWNMMVIEQKERMWVRLDVWKCCLLPNVSPHVLLSWLIIWWFAGVDDLCLWLCWRTILIWYSG